MAEGTRVTKTTETKAEVSIARVRKAECTQFINSPVEQILFLQRTAGNQAVQKLIKSRALQAKLRISQPNEIHEQEANRIAEQVIRMPDPVFQKQTNSEEEKEEIVQANPLFNHITPLVQRQVEEENEEEPIQRKEAGQNSEVSSDIHTIIKSLQGGGQPLPDQVRGYFEPRFGQDFGHVRVHTDSNAILAAHAINAKAFTVGYDVVFGEGYYEPNTIEGKKLLGHELTHVIQQGGKRNSIYAKEESDENLSWWEKTKKWAFEKALNAAGIPKEQIMGLIKRAGSAISSIFEDPGRFLSILIKAVGQGFIQFKDRIDEHLKVGFMGWLFGTMTKAGIELPKDFSLKSILTLVMQVLGITASFIRQKFVKLIGDKNVQRFEKAWQVLSTLMNEGIGGLWNMLKEYLSNLKEMVIDQIRNWVITEIIKSAVMKVVSMFNPVSGLISIIKTIYNMIKFLIERAGQIKELFAAILSSVVELAMGSISNAANKIEQALARFVPVAIGFLASLLGIGGITDKIKEIIKRVSSTVDKAIDKVISKITKGVKRLLGKDDKKKGNETPEKSAVKAAALSEVKAKIHERKLSSVSDMQVVLTRVLSKYRPKGLKSLSTQISDKETMSLTISASASEPDKDVLEWKNVYMPYDLTEEDLENLRETFQTQGYETHAILLVNGELIDEKSNSSEGHAEKLISKSSWNEAVEWAISRAKHDDKTVITLLINRTPCPTCADLLVEKIEDAQVKFLANQLLFRENVRFILAPTGVYEPAPKLSDEELKAKAEEFVEKYGMPFHEAIKKVPKRKYGQISREHATKQGDLEKLISSGWDLRQLLAREKPTQSGRILLEGIKNANNIINKSLTEETEKKGIAK